MQSQIPLYRLLVLAFLLPVISACSPLGWFIVSPTQNQAPTPEIRAVQVPTAATSTQGAVSPGSSAPIIGWNSFTSIPYPYSFSFPSDWTMTVENRGALGDAQNIERVLLRQPGYGQPNQSSTITMEVAQRAYVTTGQCQGRTEVVPGIQGCRRSLPKAQNPAQEIAWFQLPPASGSPEAYFVVQLVYDDARYVATFDQILRTFKITGAASSVLRPTAMGKTFASTKHQYTVSYPTNWTIDIQSGSAGGPGRDPEYVYFHPSASNMPTVEVIALKGAPPITGFENCNKNLVFRGIPACSLSLPKGQQPAQQLLIFQKGESFYQIAIQYEVQQQLAVFEEFVKSFQFTQ